MTPKQLLVLAIKLAVAGGLIAWLLVSGTLDLGALSILLDDPALAAANLGVFAFTTVLGALRWRLLLRLAGVHLPVARTMQLAFTAIFFNVVVPGNIGGDVIKSLYVARDVPREQRTGVFVVAFLDRVLALAGLVLVAAVLTLARGGEVWQDPRMRSLTITILVLVVATFVGPIFMLWLLHRAGRRAEEWTSSSSRLGRLLGQLVAAGRLVAAGPRTLITALGMAVTTHVAGILLFAALATAITTREISVFSLASVYPLGMLSMVLPISYAGFGVGHVAFDQLFAMVGLTGGATVANVYLIGQTVPCLFGVVPYLTLKKQAAPPSEAEARDVTMKTVAIIQSNYIPWKGYFDVIHDAELFIFHDCVQYTKQDWRNRNKIKMRDGLHLLSVPVKASKDSRICDVTLADEDWAGKHMRTLHHSLGKAPHWKALESFLADLYGQPWTNLSDLNQTLITRIARDWLAIETEIVDSRPYNAVGAKTERVLDLLVKTGATKYVSGPAAQDYIEQEKFDAAGIELVYKDYRGYPDYPQPHPPFDHSVTILDLLACMGRDAPKYIWGWRS